MNNKIIITILVLLLVIIGVFLIFRSGNNGSIENEQIFIEEEEITEEEEEIVQEVIIKEFSIDGISGYRFSVNEIRVNHGDLVRINFKNIDSMPHDIVIDEFNVATTILNKDQSEIIEFIASERGIYEYYCSVGSHRERGMVGKLIIE